ncbi:alpha-glucan family phosphorylase [Acidihalobacter ferrooxydans]|uniref:Alpha-glucan phosphorylase n=1 Tax=Acidihalobacter ferrooxydans TaxID=1765967 RepID=A0A1P8UF71_9GAMM|nr:alpha-glucan family phosphorylase [Acidihalobacter ferrooxydans]APZ42439.1 alpha-glucan phosphorylase [Acidihalobacter ferrooxydans]
MTHMQHYTPRELPTALAGLAELALDLRWSWNHTSDKLWRTIDPELWETTGNPWLIMEIASHQRLQELATDRAFLAELQQQLANRQDSLSENTWFDALPNAADLKRVAYFSMEFGLSEALPIYSGGLGILAGDMLKTASDLGVPMVGVGLLYQQGYFRQVLDADGRQLAYFPYNNPAMLPVLPLRDANGEWLHVDLELPGRILRLRCWEVTVGRIRLLLLDANGMSNHPRDRGITGELYGGDNETRLQQELILGIGGWRMLEALGLPAQVCHLNEGHAAFAVLERAAGLMRTQNLDFDTALRATRAGNLFTTHTPVAPAFDRFPPALIQQYLAPFAERWGVDLKAILALGREHPDHADEPFNMAWLALRGSGAANGVSRLHGVVSRALFAPLFARWPLPDIPVGHVTNGVHMPSWDSAAADALWTQACGKARWNGEMAHIEQGIAALSDATLWDFRARQRQRLVDAVRRRHAHQAAGRGEDPARTDVLNALFDPNTLTLGFARRFTGYKRTNLLLAQPERLLRLLGDPQRPVQLVLAGKAHPRDLEGQEMLRQWAAFIARADLPPGRLVFVEDYDMSVAAELVQGVDVWINTPRRPFEASGTSGMKVLINGGINLSELDGWWAEAYAPEVGWALGDGAEHGADPSWDAAEADALYRLLETAVVPEFYARDETGLPRRWIARVRESMARLTPVYSTNRMLREYVEHYYLPRAQALDARLADQAAAAHELQQWAHRIRTHWPALRIGPRSDAPDTDGVAFDVQIYLDDLPPDDVAVQLYAEPPAPDAAPERHALLRGEPLPGAINAFHYHLRLDTTRPASDYTVRVVPNHPLASVPLEEASILWPA